MKQEKEYIFKERESELPFYIISSSIFLIILGIFCYALFRGPLVLSRVMILLLIILLVACVIRLQYYVIRITQQFTKYDDNKIVVISTDRSQLSLMQNDKTIVLNHDEVARVESYEQKYLGNFGSYNYIVIYTNDERQILLTNFTVPLLLFDSMMTKFLRGKPRTYFKKRFNYIDQTKFKTLSVN